MVANAAKFCVPNGLGTVNLTFCLLSYFSLHQMLMAFPNLCILRVRMPISDDLSPRNFITKIVKYEKASHNGLV